MLSHPNQGLIQGNKEILHLVPDHYLPPLPFNSIPPLPPIIQLFPRQPVPCSHSIATLAPEDQVSSSFLLYPAQAAQGVPTPIPNHLSPLSHIPFTDTQVGIPQDRSPVPPYHPSGAKTPLGPLLASHILSIGPHPSFRHLWQE